MCFVDVEGVGHQQRMLVVLDDDECVAARVLVGDVPGRLGRAGLAADTETRSLAERVKRKAAMLAQKPAFRRLDGTGAVLEVPAQEFLKRALADEADSGAVRLVGDPRKSGGVGAAPDLDLGELTERKQSFRERARADAVQKIALILRLIAPLEEPGAGGAVVEPGVMAGGDAVGAEAVHVFQADAELDLAVAEHVRVRRATCRIFTQKAGEYALAVLGREAHPMERNSQGIADGARILEVFGGGAVRIAVLLPIGHEEPLNRETGIPQQERRDGRVDAAGHADDDRLGGVRMRGRGGHPPIIIYRRCGCGA